MAVQKSKRYRSQVKKRRSLWINSIIKNKRFNHLSVLNHYNIKNPNQKYCYACDLSSIDFGTELCVSCNLSLFETYYFLLIIQWRYHLLLKYTDFDRKFIQKKKFCIWEWKRYSWFFLEVPGHPKFRNTEPARRLREEYILQRSPSWEFNFRNYDFSALDRRIPGYQEVLWNKREQWLKLTYNERLLDWHAYYLWQMCKLRMRNNRQKRIINKKRLNRRQKKLFVI